MALFCTKTSETQSGLTTATVLLGQINGKLLDYFASVARQCSKESTVTIHDDEAKLLIALE